MDLFVRLLHTHHVYLPHILFYVRFVTFIWFVTFPFTFVTTFVRSFVCVRFVTLFYRYVLVRWLLLPVGSSVKLPYGSLSSLFLLPYVYVTLVGWFTFVLVHFVTLQFFCLVPGWLRLRSLRYVRSVGYFGYTFYVGYVGSLVRYVLRLRLFLRLFTFGLHIYVLLHTFGLRYVGYVGYGLRLVLTVDC